MSESRAFVRPVRVEYRCDACGNAPMEFTGQVLTTAPPLYRHKCGACGRYANLSAQYPRIDYDPEPK
jgi:hypothetical protein